MKRIHWILACLLAMLCIAALHCKKDKEKQPANNYTITVTTQNNQTEFNKGDQINFSLQLLDSGQPVDKEILVVVDNLSKSCINLPATDQNGETTFTIIASQPGALSFLFMHLLSESFMSYAVFIDEPDLNDSIQYIQNPYPVLPLGANVPLFKDSLIQKSVSVTRNLLTETKKSLATLTPVTLCLIGVDTNAMAGPPTVSPMAAVACPADYYDEIGCPLYHVISMAIAKFETDPNTRDKLNEIIHTLTPVNPITAFSCIPVQSPLAGIALLGYHIPNWQGTDTRQKVFQQIDEIGGALQNIGSIANPEIEILSDTSFLCSFLVPEPLNYNCSSKIDDQRIVTIGYSINNSSKIPALTGAWEGTADDSGDPFTHYTVEAQFTQNDLAFDGYVQWYDNWGGEAKENISGIVSLPNQVTFDGTSLENVVNKFPGGGTYILGNYFATLTPCGDSLIGGWTSGTPGVMVLKKK